MASQIPRFNPNGFLLLVILKDIAYSTPVAHLKDLCLRIVAVYVTVTPEMMIDTWRELEYCLDIRHATRGAHRNLLVAIQNFGSPSVICCKRDFHPLIIWLVIKVLY